jgi:hypothetical protein
MELGMAFHVGGFGNNAVNHHNSDSVVDDREVNAARECPPGT